MFNATFYTFAKRINSTKQPSGGTSYSIELKAPSDVLNPTIKLDVGQSGNPTAYNYCYIAEFNRYYWVRWRWENRLWIGECTIDPMASWKSSIGSYNAYVLRSASVYDGDIMDMYYPALAEVTELKNDATQDPGWTRSLSNGTFVIGVMGKSPGQNGGAITYYTMTTAAMVALCGYLLDDTNYSSITEISPDLLKCIFNPLQYIVSCMWYPFSLDATNKSAVTEIDIGWWVVNGFSTAGVVTDPVYTRNIAFNVPKHPQAARGNYLNMPPFTSYFLNAGPWGVIPINNISALDETSIGAQISVDLYTGTGRLSILTNDVIAYCEDHVAQIGVPIQLGQNVLNQGALVDAAGGAANTIQSAISGNLSGLLGGGVNTIMSAAEVSQSVPSTIGSNGSFAFNTLFNIVGRFLKVADEDLTSRGRPLCSVRTISTLSGYIECADADPDIPCTDRELSEIISNMNGGFYYE